MSSMSRVLALDTATDACTLALCGEGDVRARHEQLARAHNRHILGMLADILAERSLASAVDVIACGVGPRLFHGSQGRGQRGSGSGLGAGHPGSRVLLLIGAGVQRRGAGPVIRGPMGPLDDRCANWSALWHLGSVAGGPLSRRGGGFHLSARVTDTCRVSPRLLRSLDPV